MSKYILSIDQGTTSCRAIVFDPKGAVLGLGQQEFKQHFPQPGWVEHDASEILTVQIACIKDAIKNAKVDATDIACVGVTNQRETTVVWNWETGKPIHNAIVWQCRRTQEFANKLKRESDIFRKKTGLIPDAYFSGPKVKWILENVEGAKELANEGKLAFGTIDTWLIWNLTQDQNHLTEPSNASRTMMFNIQTLEWDDALLERLGVPRNMMPRVIPSNGEFGLTDPKKVGFTAPILANLGDQQAALFGQACFRKGMAKCTYGTGSFLLANIGSSVKMAPGLLTTVAWQIGQDAPTYAFEGSVFIAGAAMQWLRDELGIIKSTDETEALASSLDGNDGVYFVPAFVGLGSPWWDSDARGSIFGLTRGTTKAHLVRAALESMAYSVADVTNDMANSGSEVLELRVDGGATKNLFMLQFQSDLCSFPVLRSSQLESTAWGVAALAALRFGFFKSDKEIYQLWRNDLTVEPKNDRDKDYDGWRRAMSATQAWSGNRS